MRAFIEHRGHYRFFIFNPKFTLYLRLEFSNEERAIVRTRALQNYGFDLSPGFLGSSESQYSGPALQAMEAGGLALFGIGFICIFVAAGVSAFGPVALTCLIAGVLLFWHAQKAKRREKSAYLKELTLGYLLDNPSLSIQTVDPAQAPHLEENIRLRLTKLKYFLGQMHRLATERVFEM